jgi:hypothetical protein
MKYSKEEKAMRLEDWRGSGQCANAYAKANGIVPWTFHRWVKEEAQTAHGFVEVSAQAMPSVRNQEVVVEKGEIRIHIPATMSAAQIENVMEGLRRAI